MDTKKKLDLIVSWIERWIAANPRRTIQMLSRQAAVPYPTLRRVMQQETFPTTDTAMSLLNIVATLPECMEYFEGNESIQRFYRRVSANATVAGPDLIEKYMDPDSFWILNLALSIGASRENVSRLLGASGVEKFEEMLSQGILVEQSFGIYGASVENPTVFVENKRFGREAVKNVAAIPSEDDPLERVIIYGVNGEGYRDIRQLILECYRAAAEKAEMNPGAIMAAFSFVSKQIAKDPGGNHA